MKIYKTEKFPVLSKVARSICDYISKTLIVPILAEEDEHFAKELEKKEQNGLEIKCSSCGIVLKKYGGGSYFKEIKKACCPVLGCLTQAQDEGIKAGLVISAQFKSYEELKKLYKKGKIKR